ncbi:MAG TPA: hypothetical protein DCO83_00840 [Mucilaginibacter sp.]|nr:hypothetical protein [Mucilaginibacter sp.]
MKQKAAITDNKGFGGSILTALCIGINTFYVARAAIFCKSSINWFENSPALGTKADRKIGFCCFRRAWRLQELKHP